jgi:hypothetical protein
MAEIEGAIEYWTSVPVLSIVFDCAVNMKLPSLFRLEFSQTVISTKYTIEYVTLLE